MDVPPIEPIEASDDSEAIGSLDVESVSFLVGGPSAEPERDSGLDSLIEAAATDFAPVADLLPTSGDDSSRLVSEALREFGAKLDRGLTDLRAIVERDRRAEETREKIVDRLHSELQHYKEDLIAKMMRPIFLDLIQLHDDLGKRADSGADGAATEALLRDYQKGVEDILYRQGVEPYEAEGDSFDARRQRAVTTLPCDDPQLVKTVAARIRKGFASGDRVIRPESVSVFAARRASPADHSPPAIILTSPEAGPPP